MLPFTGMIKTFSFFSSLLYLIKKKGKIPKSLRKYQTSKNYTLKLNQHKTMTKKIITIITTILLCSFSTLAQENEKNSPFLPDAESYENIIKNNYENLPNVTNISDIDGTENIAEAQAQKKLTGKIRPHNTTSNYEYTESKIIGKPNITAKGPITDTIIKTSIVNVNKKLYFWIITGNIQYHQRKLFTKNIEKRNDKFFYVIHFENNHWKEDFLLIGNIVFYNNNTIQNIVSKTSEPLIKQKNKKLYDTAIKKEKWTFNNRELIGKLIDYKNGKVHIQGEKSKIPFKMDVTKFSIEDQILIRGFIDHLDIPARELQQKKSR
jgi:hypothetical protein